MLSIFRNSLPLLLLYPTLLPAQELPPWSFNFFLENDMFANTDLNYTNGIRLSTISPDLDSFQDPDGQKYPWVEKLNTMLEFVHPSPANPDNDPVHQNMVISFGQLLFTPEDRSTSSLIADDRPYAGYLYLGLGYHARTANVLHSTEFNFGVVGPAALGRQSQNLVHKILGIDEFQGWDHQLENEPAFQLVFERKYRNDSVDLPLPGNLKFQAITHWGASLGTVSSYANTGVELRLGQALPDDYGTSTLRPGGDNNTPGIMQTAGTPLRAHFYIATDVRLVANNIFLDGNYFRGSHGVDRRIAVADVAAGIAGTWKKFRFSYAHIYRTREFEQQREAQFYGSFSLSYRYSF